MKASFTSIDKPLLLRDNVDPFKQDLKRHSAQFTEIVMFIFEKAFVLSLPVIHKRTDIGRVYKGW